MTIRKLLVLTAVTAVGVALATAYDEFDTARIAAFGVGVLWLAATPMFALLIARLGNEQRVK